MSTDDRLRNRRTIRNPLLLLGFFMTLVYIGLGAWLFIDKSFLPGLPPDFRNIFAVMLLAYGGYRGWRLYADFF